MTRFRILAAGSVCLVAVMSSAGFGDDKTTTDPANAVIERFTKSLQADTQLSDAQRKVALQQVAKFSANKETRDMAIAQGLREISPAFAKALNALGSEDYKTAAKELQPLTKSKNPYLAAESRYELARTLLMQEQVEAALPLLDQVIGDQKTTLRVGDSLFLKGSAQMSLLKRKEAQATLARFLKEFPDAPGRIRIAAWRRLDALHSIEKGSMPDIHEHMEFSRRKLAQEHSGEKTQDVQKKIVAMLDTMIDEIEKKGGS